MRRLFKRIKKALWFLRHGTALKCPSCKSENVKYIAFEINTGIKKGVEHWQYECLDCHVLISHITEWGEVAE